jgi:hypothetical protein
MLFRVLALTMLSLSLTAFWSTDMQPGGEACRRAAAQQAAARPFDYEHEIFFAVLEGCFVDGVSNESVDAILADDPQSGMPANFIKGCPICMPARDALRVYRARPKFEGRKGVTDTYGPGLDARVTAALASGDVYTRQQQIMQLVESWLARRVDVLRLDDYERKEWQINMADRRKKGMALLESYQRAGNSGTYAQMKTCPFCEAANGACGNK